MTRAAHHWDTRPRPCYALRAPCLLPALPGSPRGDGGSRPRVAQTLVLAAITSLKKLCNHPSLLVDNGKVAEGFEEAISMLPPDAIARTDSREAREGRREAEPPSARRGRAELGRA